jgi:hypothetical protein
MRSADPPSRAFPPIRRLLVVALLAMLATVAGRQVLAGDRVDAVPPADPALAAVPGGLTALGLSGMSGASGLAGVVDEHAAEGLSAVLPAGRRASERESLVVVPVVPDGPTAPAITATWGTPPIVVPAGEPAWAPLGARAPPRA